METKEDYGVKKLRVTREIQKELTSTFSNAQTKLMNADHEYIEFDGSYKPDMDEILYIENFELPETIKNAIKVPTSTGELRPKEAKDQEINAIFTGKVNNDDEYLISFQNFQRNQIISGRGIGIILAKDTFKKIDKLALNFKDEVDCVYQDNNLYFSSYWIARQVFDLSEYYKKATDKDLHEFIQRDELYCQNESVFMANSDDWIRRKVAMIQDKQVLEKYSAKEIKKAAHAHNVQFKLEGEKIFIPDEKQELKDMLKFLDENIYKGPLTQET